MTKAEKIKSLKAVILEAKKDLRVLGVNMH